MREALQIQITEGPHSLVLSDSAGVTVEDRERLADVVDVGTAGRFRFTLQGKVCTAVRLAHLTAVEAGAWRQAVFIAGADRPAAVIVAEGARLTERDETEVECPFTVAGWALEGPPLFRGVLVGSGAPRLVIDREILIRHAARITTP